MKKMTPEEIKYSFWNNKAWEASRLPEEAINMQPSVYEVVRVLSGVPLFLEEHLDRLGKSIALLNFQYDLPASEIREQIKSLIQINGYPQQNIKIIANMPDSRSPNIFMFFIPSQYPAPEDYCKGVRTITLKAERHNPNAKVVEKHLREEINKAIEAKHAYEAILINSREEITEGSRSNIFFVKHNKLYTAPAKDVLVGITRSRIISIAEKLHTQVVEAPIPAFSLQEFQGVFLTGTSPRVLPIAAVDALSFDSFSNALITQIMESYNALIADYVSSFRW